ncbi:MAG: TIGR01777 family oxidoreductase [Thermoplasmatota archaeon]
MKVATSGAGGLIGDALCRALEARGDTVVRLVRRPPQGPGERQWGEDGVEGGLADVDAVVHLAGESIGARRWSQAQKARILDSRVQGTQAIARAVAAARPDAPRPPRLVVASAVGFYGHQEDPALLSEEAPAGEGFLAEVVQAWEAAAEPARAAGAKVAHARFGVVLDADGGALARMLTPFKLGVGGRVGNGRQGMPWVTKGDAVAALLHLVDGSQEGPHNVVAGTSASLTFTKTLATVLGRPHLFPLPAFMVRLMLGEMGQALLLDGQWVDAARLRADGFRFGHDDLEEALRHVLARPAQGAK